MRWFISLFLVTVFMTTVSIAAPTNAQDISFWEEFALSEDRPKTLEKLVPGSEDYYFFHCLHAQNNEKLDEVDSLLKRWIKRRGRTEQVLVIENRQALLKYGEDPKQTLDHLQKQLGLNFGHQRRIPEAQKDLPTTLKPNLIDPVKIAADYLRRDTNSLGNFDFNGFYYLTGKPLNVRQRRDLLKRVTDPTFPGIVDLIAKDLKGKDATTFGRLGIHQQLTQSQLEQLVKQVPTLQSQQAYINEVLLRMAPSEDIDITADANAYRKYLDDQWAFVETLNSNFNSLKAGVLFRLLELDQRENKMNRKRFVRYLQLPRNANYINRLLNEKVARKTIASLQANYAEVTRCLPINNDEPLVRDYLHHFLGSAANSEAFAQYFERSYLKREFATAKILAGNGDRETLASMLTPEQYQALLDRIDLDFSASNQEFFGVDDTVELELFTKNVDKLIVKVFEINTKNFYAKNGREVDTDIALDGLIANDEKLYEYNDAPLLRKSRKFTFDKLSKRGVYVIDFIGGGKSSRALVRKGQLQLTGRVMAFGQQFNVVNESGVRIMDATLTIGGQNYTAEKDGTIAVPFSTKTGPQKAIVTQGRFSCLQLIRPVSESYSLRSAFHVDRESLAANSEATVVIRPSLSVAGTPIPLSRLESCKLQITSTTIDGITSTKTISDLAVTERQEATATFLVPPRLSNIQFRLEANLKTLLKSDQTLAVSDSFTINQIDSSSEIQDLHLRRTTAGWMVEVLGKTGERRPGQPVRFQFRVRGLKSKINVDLQSNDEGQIELGSLDNITWVEAKLAGGTERRWNPNPEQMHLASDYHFLSGESLTLPFPNGDDQLDPKSITLLETRGQRYARDCFANMAIKNQRLEISKLEPGDYQLFIRSPFLESATKAIRIRVTAGSAAGNALVGKHRVLQQLNPQQPFATAAAIEKDTLTIQIADATETTRVHVFPVRYLNAFDPFDDFKSIRTPGLWTLSPAVRKSAYMAGRKIGEEYQYILNRRYAPRFPGNMLDRPDLLLNPWAVQDTDNTSQLARKGQDAGAAGAAKPKVPAAPQSQNAGAVKHVSFANLDFLGGGEDVILNLAPNQDGQIKLTSEQIGNAQEVRVVVVDQFSVAQTQVLRKPLSFKAYDQRLANALDQDKHFRQSRQIELMGKGDQLVIDDILSAQYQQYDQLSDVFRLYQGMGNDAEKLRTFQFVLDWMKNKQEEKQSLYSEHACHELNFYLYHKDRKFFDDVVRDHLLNKRERTFLDQWLLEEDLAAWMEPWRFARLNVVEKILLSQRYEDRREDLARHVAELYDLSPTPRSRHDELYRYSIASGSLSNLSVPQDGQVLLGGILRDGGGAGYGGGGGRFGNSFENVDENGNGGGAIMLNVQDVRRSERLLGANEVWKSDRKVKKQPRFERQSRLSEELGVDEETIKEIESNYFFENGVMTGDRLMISGKFQQLYRRVEPTREWIENNYYHLLPSDQNASLVTVNQFWKDYANHSGDSFASQWFAEANRNFTEMMFALAVLDLPLQDVEEQIEVADGQLTITASGPMIVLHQQNRASDFDRADTTVFVSENFFQANDRYRHENGVQFDKFVKGKFLANMLYGSEVVITNPTSTPMAIELLIQIPKGAIPASGSQQTRSISMQLNAFSTQKVEYAFYFPAPGEFTHYPAHVSSDVKILAVAEGQAFTVVDEPAAVDQQSWAWVSQNASPDDVLEFLNRENIQRINPVEIAFRMKDKAFFQKAIDTLRNRCRYDHTLWSYSVKHNDTESMQEFLEYADGITGRCGMAFESELLTIDPQSRNWYEQRDFSPLVNSRAHQLGSTRKILNSRVRVQYEKLMKILGHRASLTSDNHLAVTYYLLLQDRIDEAMKQFDKIESKNVVRMMPYAYCDAYLDLYREKPDDAMAKAKKWTAYPVDRWRQKFESIVAMVKEINGGSGELIKESDRTQQQDQLATNAPGFDFKIEASGEKRGEGRGSVEWRNLSEMTINYYEMDIEFLFSSNPFARDQIDGFSMIRPNFSQTVTVEEGQSKGTHQFDLPEQFANKNVLVEVVAGDSSKSEAWYANSMEVQVIESYGQVLLSDPVAKRPISKAYVKVFAKSGNGEVKFHKDGYTDLRGRFDFVTQSNQSLNGITEYAILIISDEHGAVIEEARPPRE